MNVYEFQRNRRPRNYLSRREQVRLLLLVMSLGLAIILTMEARKPRNWQWLFAGSKGEGRTATGEEVPTDGREIDTRLGSRRPDKQIPDAFFSPGAAKTDHPGGGKHFPGVKPDYLESVRDDTTFRANEHDAWFHLMDVLGKTDEAVLEKASVGRVTFVQLSKQSKEYRGELVTIGGTLRRAHYVRARKNDFGIKGYYQTWVQPADRRDFLVVVYCLFLPEDFPTGMKLAEEVRITGFYYKRWAYRAQDTLRTAPTLLARTVRWRKAPVVVDEPPVSFTGLLLLIAVTATFGILAAVYLFSRAGGARAGGSAAAADADAQQDVRRRLEELES